MVLSPTHTVRTTTKQGDPHVHSRSNHSTVRRFGVATALGALLGAGGLFTLLGAGGPVNALDVAEGDGQPQPPTPPIEQLDDLFPEDDPILDVPVLTIPTDDDGRSSTGRSSRSPIRTTTVRSSTDRSSPSRSHPGDTTHPTTQRPSSRPPSNHPAEQPEGPRRSPASDAPTDSRRCCPVRAHHVGVRSTAPGWSTSPTTPAPPPPWHRRTSTS